MNALFSHSHCFLCASHRLYPIARRLLRPITHKRPFARNDAETSEGENHRPPSAAGIFEPARVRHCEARALALWAGAPKQSLCNEMQTAETHALSNGVEQHECIVLTFTLLPLCFSSFVPCCQEIASPHRT